MHEIRDPNTEEEEEVTIMGEVFKVPASSQVGTKLIVLVEKPRPKHYTFINIFGLFRPCICLI